MRCVLHQSPFTRTPRSARVRHDPNQSNIVVSPSRPDEALHKTYPSATDGFTYRFKMVMAEGRPYSEVVSTLAFPGPFTLITPEPTARPSRCHAPEQASPRCILAPGVSLVGCPWAGWFCGKPANRLHACCPRAALCAVDIRLRGRALRLVTGAA